MVSSGFNVQTTPRTTNGIEIIPIMAKTLTNADSGMSGLFTTHGNGKVTTNQIAASKIINLIFFLFSGFNNKISC